MSQLPSVRRTTIALLALTMAVGLGAASCTSTPDVTDPTTTVQALTGTTSTTRAPGTTVGTTRTTGTTRPSDSDDPEADDQQPTGDETAADYSDALIASFDANPDEVFTIDVVRCVSPKWVDAIGVETFQAAGITPDEIASNDAGLDDVTIDQATGEAIVAAVPPCGLPLIDLFLDQLPSSIADHPDQIACVKANVTEDQVRDVLVRQIQGEDVDPEDLVGACLD